MSNACHCGADRPGSAAVDLAPIGGLLDELGPVQHNDLIPILQRIQDLYGYLPRAVVDEVSRRTGIPASHMFGVATFYAQFHLQPRGRHSIKACRGTACHVRGSQAIVEAVSQELGIKDGQTTPDGRFTLETVACLGTCFLAPAVMIDDQYYGNLTPKAVAPTIQNFNGGQR
jgi:NADH-quinone oxidoreductase subunit E